MDIGVPLNEVCIVALTSENTNPAYAEGIAYAREHNTKMVPAHVFNMLGSTKAATLAYAEAFCEGVQDVMS